MEDFWILFMGMWLVILLVLLVVMVLEILAYWMIFRKAGEAGWKSLIPFYSTYTEYKLVWNEKMFFLWLAIAVVAFISRFIPGPGAFLTSAASLGMSVMYILVSIKMSYSFGHGVGYALGLIFLPPIFLLILAFDDSRYIGPGGNYMGPAERGQG